MTPKKSEIGPRKDQRLTSQAAAVTGRKRSSQGSRSPAERPEATHVQKVSARAYHLFLDRGGEGDHALDDWLQAEREIAEAIEPE